MLGQEQALEARAMLTIYEERGIEKGIIQGKRNTLLRLLHRKFGDLPAAIEARAQNIETDAELDVLLDRLIDARSLDEMRLS